MGGSSVLAVPGRVVTEQTGEGDASAREPRLDGALGAALEGGDVGDGEAGEVVQDQRAALGFGKLRESRGQGDALGAGAVHRLGWPAADQVESCRPPAAPAADRLPGGDLSDPGARVVVRPELRP